MSFEHGKLFRTKSGEFVAFICKDVDCEHSVFVNSEFFGPYTEERTILKSVLEEVDEETQTLFTKWQNSRASYWNEFRKTMNYDELEFLSNILPHWNSLVINEKNWFNHITELIKNFMDLHVGPISSNLSDQVNL